MSYIKQDEFTNICYENDCDPYQVKAALESLGKSVSITQVRNRIANYRRKGLLTLESGNKVAEGEFLLGSSTLYGPDGSIKQQWVKTDTKSANTLAEFTQAIEDICNLLPAYTSKPAPPAAQNMSDLITFYPLGDPHIGMLAHHDEVGEDNDLSIATNRLQAAMQLSVDQAMHTDEAFILDTGDYFHADNSSNTTPRGGNPLDVDGRYHKVLQKGLFLAATLIETALEKHQTVHWRSVEGNHDPHSSVMINMFLKAYFRNEPRVVIHSSPSAYYYYSFGKCLFGMTHGHTCKPDKLGELMAVDNESTWSQSKYRYWLLGHVHHLSVKEYPSCIVETFRTLSGKDAWHASMGYRSGQDMKIITYHKDHGEVNRSTINISLIP